MSTVRRTISLPPVIADRIDAEAIERGVSFSQVIAELASREPAPLPYGGLIDDDPDLSLRVEELLARAAI